MSDLDGAEDRELRDAQRCLEEAVEAVQHAWRRWAEAPGDALVSARFALDEAEARERAARERLGRAETAAEEARRRKPAQ